MVENSLKISLSIQVEAIGMNELKLFSQDIPSRHYSLALDLIPKSEPCVQM